MSMVKRATTVKIATAHVYVLMERSNLAAKSVAARRFASTIENAQSASKFY